MRPDNSTASWALVADAPECWEEMELFREVAWSHGFVGTSLIICDGHAPDKAVSKLILILYKFLDSKRDGVNI